ncbi:Acetyltransferase (GNAT) domain [Clarireedia jacksonii]
MSSNTPLPTQTPYIVQSEHLRLEPLNLNDHLQACHVLMSDPQCTQWSTRFPYTLQQTQDWISELGSAPGPRQWAVILLQPPSSDTSTTSPKMIGLIGVPSNSTFPSGGLAYRLHPAHWGHGYMTSAIRMFLSMFWELEEYKSFPRLGAGVDPENHGSRRVLEKAGFREGELKKEEYERAVDRGSGKRKKSDIRVMWVERPSVE